MRNKFTALLLTLLLLFLVSAAAAETPAGAPAVQSVVMEKDGNRLEYPQLSGLADAAIQQLINDDIVLSADLTSHMITFATLTPDSLWGLQVSYEACVNERVASFVISAEGKMPNNRQGQTNTPLTYDLQTGRRLTPADLFANEAEAAQWLEEEALRTLGEEISDYEDSSALIPFPMDRFSLDEYGITFWYTPQQFTTIAGRAGACRFDYDEIRHLLNTAEDGLPVASGLLQPVPDADAQRMMIRQAAENRRLPQLPVTLGEPMTDIVDRYALSRTPDEFPGGRYFAMEHPLFRSIYLISDAMESGYEHSVLEGIQLRRGAFCGLLIGKAAQEDWRQLLGDPAEIITITEGMAYDYGLPAGSCDIYHTNGCTVRFYADDQGVLAAVQFELE